MGAGTLSTGGAVTRANALGDINGVLPIASTSNWPTAGRAYVATSAGTDTLAYTGTSTTAATCGTTSGCFTGVSIVTGNWTDTVAAGGAVNRASNLNDINGILPIASVNGFGTSGSVNVPTSAGGAVLNYTGTSTTAGTCGPAACLTGVTVASGSGSVTTGSRDPGEPERQQLHRERHPRAGLDERLHRPGSVTVATSRWYGHPDLHRHIDHRRHLWRGGHRGLPDRRQRRQRLRGIANPGGSVGQTDSAERA